MNTAYIKNIFRTIKKSMGRYLAIMAIIALGVGFFSGIKVTKPAMIASAGDFYKDTNFFDFKLISTYGFSDEEVEKIQAMTQVDFAEGGYSTDFLYIDEEGSEAALKAMSLPESINTVEIKEGRLPQNANECVLDAAQIDTTQFDSSILGKKIIVADSNLDETKDVFKYKEYTVVGLVYSPLYISFERGTTNLGSGKLGGFMYILGEGFDMEYFTEMYVSVHGEFDLYDSKYDDYIEKLKPTLAEKVQSNAVERHDKLLEELKEEYGNVVTDTFYSELISGNPPGELTDAQDVVVKLLEEMTVKIESLSSTEPETFVLDRSTNTAYLCFDNDTNIVDGLAKVFPVFFFLIAALVCSTTMTRMIDDERGQIGTLRALGYTNTAIIWKYMVYSGSAAMVGCIGGFFAGSKVFPFVIGEAYKMLYDYGRSVEFYFEPNLLIITIIVSLLCSIGTTYFACKNELRCMPAELIRPKAPVAGKRIFLEKISFVWKKMKFLHKITTRNVFRFKKRMIMMILGISGCTALVMAGFGIKDSVSNIAEFQYDEIEVYDMEVTFTEKLTEASVELVEEQLSEEAQLICPLYKTTVEYHLEDAVKSVYLCTAEEDSVSSVVNFQFTGSQGSYPGYGEIMLSDGIADMADIEVGDMITLNHGENKEVTLKVSGIYKNYVWHYGYITPDTYEDFFGEGYSPNTMFVNMKKDRDAYETAAMLSELDLVLNVTVIQEVKGMISNTMKMLDVVVWLVIGCAGALALIVLFNLSNINITERIREIATIKVLGFYQRETGAYIFRENLVLTIIGIIFGIPLGTVLNGFIISQIKVDMFIIKETLFPISYLFTVILVFFFLKLADWVMRGKVSAIDMAESLKSIE